MSLEFYRFRPLLKQTIWGGDKIIGFKHMDETLENVGESWELSGVKGQETIVSEGPKKGMRLNDLVAEMGANLLGDNNYERFGNEFPLLIKFIDARRDLSIQVHPDDATAHRHGRPRGKTEMWYIMDSDADASIRVGLNRRITSEEYARRVADDTITDVICHYKVKEGDCFHIPAGRIHAICGGTFLAEIQQTSDATYRIYDYNRRDKDGNLRQLHTKEASEAIDYTVEQDYHTIYTPQANEMVKMVDCPFFTTSVLDLDGHTVLDYSELNSFIIIIALKGEAQIGDGRGATSLLQAGETILLPATIQKIGIKGSIKLLETHVITPPSK